MFYDGISRRRRENFFLVIFESPHFLAPGGGHHFFPDPTFGALGGTHHHTFEVKRKPCMTTRKHPIWQTKKREVPPRELNSRLCGIHFTRAKVLRKLCSSLFVASRAHHKNGEPKMVALWKRKFCLFETSTIMTRENLLKYHHLRTFQTVAEIFRFMLRNFSNCRGIFPRLLQRNYHFYSTKYGG